MEYKIDENTTYVDGGYNSESIRYSQKDGANLTVEFYHESTRDGDYISDYHEYNGVKVSIQKPKQIEESKEEKAPEVNRARQNVFKKLFAKKQKTQDMTSQQKSSSEEEAFSTEKLFHQKFNAKREYRMGEEYYIKLDEFIQKPIPLKPEWQEVGKMIEKARQTILTDGHRLREEAIQKAQRAEAQKKADREQKEARERSMLDQQVADKIKGYGL